MAVTIYNSVPLVLHLLIQMTQDKVISPLTSRLNVFDISAKGVIIFCLICVKVNFATLFLCDAIFKRRVLFRVSFLKLVFMTPCWGVPGNQELQ